MVLDDSWGHSAFSYDAAGRLSSAQYPDGAREQEQYDAAGNRLVITSTTPLSGTSVTNVTQNQYDAADELVLSTSGVSGTTAYRYATTRRATK